MTGLAAGIFLGTLTALLVLPRHGSAEEVADRPRTSLLDTSMSLALLGLYVQLDILVAPSVLTLTFNQPVAPDIVTVTLQVDGSAVALDRPSVADATQPCGSI